MGLVVVAQVIRELIADGEYLVECIEHRDRGKVAVAFVLRSRARLAFNRDYGQQAWRALSALLDEEPSRAGHLVWWWAVNQCRLEVDGLPHGVRVANGGNSGSDRCSGPRSYRS
jgi:hypothetical protein